MNLSITGTPLEFGGQKLQMPLPRITVVGKELRRLKDRFQSWGYQHLEYYYMAEYFTAGGDQERTGVTNDIQGNRRMGANTIRLHMDLWWFIDGPDENNLEMLSTPLNNLIYFLDVCKRNGIYVQLAGNNTWGPTAIPGWFDDLTYNERWDVSQFYWEGIATAVVAAGHSTTVLGYELANEPSINTDPDWDWYGDDVFGVGIYYRHLIARGPGVDGTTVRAWITQLRDAIKAIDTKGLVTFGAFPYWNSVFGYENTEDLLDFLSPHCYPPFELFGQTQEEMMGYLLGWTASTKPLVIGETSLWSAVPEHNTEYMEAVVVNYSGVMSFSFGYPPEEFTVPPEVPKFPANPETPASTYAAQGAALALFNTYRDNFVSWWGGREALTVLNVGDSNAYASGGFTPNGGQVQVDGLYCYVSATGQVPYDEANLGWYNVDPNGTARTDEYASYLATTYANDAYIGQALGGNGNPGMRYGAVLKTGTTIDTYLYQAAVGGTTAAYWASGNGWDTLLRTIPAALASVPGSPTAFNCITISLGVNDAIGGVAEEDFVIDIKTFRSNMVAQGWWVPGVTQIIFLDMPRSGYFAENFGDWMGVEMVLTSLNDRITRTDSTGYDLDPSFPVHYLPPSYTNAGQQAGDAFLAHVERRWAT